MKRVIVICAIITVLFAGIVFTNTRLTAIRAASPAIESMAYLPGSERITPFMLGFNTTYAHYLWIQTVIYTGDHISSDGQFGWLIQMVDMITRLHPHFHEAYEFAGLIIPDFCGSPDASRIILERGINVFGDSRWNIPFYLGMLYYKYYRDEERAAAYISVAAQAPGEHKAKLARLAATFYNKAGKGADALGVLAFLYETSENPEVKRHIAAKMAELAEKSGEVSK